MATRREPKRTAAEKSAQAFRTISEVSDEIGVPQHVLRFWETRFAQVKPMKRNGGRRLYRPDHVLLLHGIKALLYDDGLTIKGVQKVLREQGVRSVVDRGRIEAEGGEMPAPAVPEDVAERLSALKARVGQTPESAETEDNDDVERVRGSIARLEAILDRLEDR
ncbi:MAG: MerR family transcriptional regulator [Pseudomonadota bacterium]